MAVILDDDFWVCTCCMLQHANGECCEGQHNPENGPAPWGLLTTGRPAMGGTHVDGCPNGPDGPRDTDCDCGTREYSRSSCDGCGQSLDGTRYAFTIFAD